MGEVATNAPTPVSALNRVLENCHSRGLRVRNIRDRLQAATDRVLGPQPEAACGSDCNKPESLIAEFDMVDSTTCEILSDIESLLDRLETAI